MNKPPCDCLDWCGDDPWLKDGRAETCQERKERERRAAEEKASKDALVALLDRLVDSAEKHGSIMVTRGVMSELREAALRFIQ